MELNEEDVAHIRALAKSYANFRDSALSNLWEQSRDGASATSFSSDGLKSIENDLCYSQNGSRFSLVFGEIQNGKMLTSLTSMIITLNSQILQCGIIPKLPLLSEQRIRFFQSVAVFGGHVSVVMSHIASKIETRRKMLQHMSAQDFERFSKSETFASQQRDEWQAYVARSTKELTETGKKCPDKSHMAETVRKLRVVDYIVAKYDITSENPKMINHYYLPMSIAQPMIQKIASMQAEAIAADRTKMRSESDTKS